MEKEDNRRSGASMTEADFAYVRNINTTAGRAGRSIDPTKPGPDADRIAEWRMSINYGPDGETDYAMVYNEIGVLVCNTRTHLANQIVSAVNAELARLSNEQPKGGDAVPFESEHLRRFALDISPETEELMAALKKQYGVDSNTEVLKRAIRDARVPTPAPSPEPQDVRGKIVLLAMRALERRRFAAEDGRYLLTQSQAFDAFVEVLGAFPALAQSAAQPVGPCSRCGGSGYLNTIPCPACATAPHSPDASGLIDGLLIAAAEDALAALEQAGGAALGVAMSSQHPNPDEVLTNVFHSCNKAAKELRNALPFRAADRSAPRSDRGGA